MAYTPATKVPNLTEISFFQWETPTAPAPRLASPIVAADTTIVFTSAPLDHTGAVISTAFLMGIENTDGYVETVLVHAGDLSVDGLTATGVTRGIRLEGLDWTTSDPSLASDFNQDSAVFANISGVLQALNTAGLTAQIGANIKFNGRPLFMGTGVAACPVFATTVVRDAAITAPLNGDMCYVTADGVFYDYQGGAWIARAAGTTPNASETVAGKVELATNAEMGTGTSVGGTGARLVPPNDQLVQTSSGAGDHNKLATLNASGQFASGFVNTSGLIPKSLLTAKGSMIAASAASTPSEVVVGANNTVPVADSATTPGVAFKTIPSIYGLGTLSAAKFANVVYQAATDIFVVGSYSANGGAFFSFRSDSSNPPTTVILKGNFAQTGEGSCFCVPVKSGNYYEVFAGFIVLDQMYEIPLS